MKPYNTTESKLIHKDNIAKSNVARFILKLWRIAKCCRRHCIFKNLLQTQPKITLFMEIKPKGNYGTVIMKKATCKSRYAFCCVLNSKNVSKIKCVA